MNSRTFKIPLTMAAAGLTGCGGFDFEGSWQVSSGLLTADYADGTTYTYAVDFPQTYEGDTISLSLEVDESFVNLVQLYEYDDGTTYTYTEGPYPWLETEKKRFEITGDFDWDTFVCDADPDDDDKLGCLLSSVDGGDSTSFSLKLDRIIP